jgi:RimJ/RimL family protein N-acetyltransferase
MAIRLRTPRLLLREWRDDDLVPFAAMWADPEVTKLLLGPFDRAKSDEWAAWARGFWDEHSYGQWVVEIPDEAPFVGVVGLNLTRAVPHLVLAVEVAWRLMRPYWGQGIAFEAARVPSSKTAFTVWVSTRSSRSPRRQTPARGD